MRKIVYFDENSATDYLTILNGGSLVISDSEEEKVGDTAEIKVGAKLKILFNSLFVSGSANLDSNIGAYTSGENFIKTTISNTTLSDFIDAVTVDDSDIKCLKGYSIYVMPNSIAYFQTITPYLAMTEGQFHIDGDFVSPSPSACANAVIANATNKVNSRVNCFISILFKLSF